MKCYLQLMGSSTVNHHWVNQRKESADRIDALLAIKHEKKRRLVASRMGSFYSFLHDLSSLLPADDEANSRTTQPYGQADCYSSTPPPSISVQQATNNSHFSRRTSISSKRKTDRYCLLSADEEKLLEDVLDAYITHRGVQDQMAESLAARFQTDLREMKRLCRTLCRLIEVKIR